MVKYDTPARWKLIALDLGPSEIARRLGPGHMGKSPHPGMVSRWLAGDARANAAHRPILESLWGITDDDWLTASERRQLKARLRVADRRA